MSYAAHIAPICLPQVGRDPEVVRSLDHPHQHHHYYHHHHHHHHQHHDHDHDHDFAHHQPGTVAYAAGWGAIIPDDQLGPLAFLIPKAQKRPTVLQVDMVGIVMTIIF